MVAVNNNSGAGGVKGVKTAGPSDTPALQLLNNARSHLGWHEGPNNENPYTKHVMGDAHQPWCAAFVSTMLEQANIPGVSKKMFSASASGLASQFQQAGRYFPRGSKEPQPGDVIFFGGRGGEHHTGIVQKVEYDKDGKHGKVYTIEGNSSDKVSERVYSLDDPGIGGYGRVFGDGQVSSDVGVDTTKAGRGTASAAPQGRAVGRGTASRALENGVDPTAYFSMSTALLLALLESMINGDSDGLDAALEQMFPNVSQEDLADLAKTLKEHPQLAAKVARHPELLQQLLANPAEKNLRHILKAPLDKTPVDRGTQVMVAQLMSSPNVRDAGHASDVMKPLLREIDATKGNGWAPKATSVSSSGNWRP
jgi:hypothetical protein